ncbi:tetratricopeptide repeat protein [Caldibacillus thermoamylovorans]
MRKDGQFAEALKIYKQIWDNGKDAYVAAGLLQCLRKLKKYEQALQFVSKLDKSFLELDWCKNEVIWTYIEGQLEQISPQESIGTVLNTAKKIMDLHPQEIAFQRVVFKVLKSAKEVKRWDIMQDWIDKVNPETLPNDPMQTSRGSSAWNKQSLWYYYKLECLYRTGQYYEVIETWESVKGNFPRPIEKYPLRLKALSYYKLGELEKAEEVYNEICKHRNPDWWLLYEYARLVKSSGKNEQALKLMFRAAMSVGKIENKVKLFRDIGLLCREMGCKEEAYYHLLLSKLIRQEKGWDIKENEAIAFQEVASEVSVVTPIESVRDAFDHCRKYWSNEGRKNKSNKRKIRRSLKGKVVLQNRNAPFCFIKVGNESFFCFTSDIPGELFPGMEVQFDAVPSFDKKKNRESWKAVNISIL